MIILSRNFNHILVYLGEIVFFSHWGREKKFDGGELECLLSKLVYFYSFREFFLYFGVEMERQSATDDIVYIQTFCLF